MTHNHSFFSWQSRILVPLLAWGVGSVVAGAGLAGSRDSQLRQIGVQSVTWGAIDAALAIAGRRGARRRLTQRDPRPGQRTEPEEARRFQAIVGANAALDLVYVLGGVWLARTAGRRRDRRGMGIGVAMQGAFLLLYDLWLVRGVRHWRVNHERS